MDVLTFVLQLSLIRTLFNSSFLDPASITIMLHVWLIMDLDHHYVLLMCTANVYRNSLDFKLFLSLSRTDPVSCCYENVQQLKHYPLLDELSVVLAVLLTMTCIAFWLSLEEL